jgi:hypothetical protein
MMAGIAALRQVHDRAADFLNDQRIVRFRAIVLKKSSNTQWRIDLRNIVLTAHLLAVICCNKGHLL